MSGLTEVHAEFLEGEKATRKSFAVRESDDSEVLFGCRTRDRAESLERCSMIIMH